MAKPVADIVGTGGLGVQFSDDWSWVFATGREGGRVDAGDSYADLTKVGALRRAGAEPVRHGGSRVDHRPGRRVGQVVGRPQQRPHGGHRALAPRAGRLGRWADPVAVEWGLMADQPTILGPDGRPVTRAYKGITGYGGGRGGLRNPASGLGGATDKGAGSFFAPTRIYWRSPLEILLRAESWAARKAIKIPIDDTFLAGGASGLTMMWTGRARRWPPPS